MGFGDPKVGLGEKLRQAMQHLGEEDTRPADSAEDHEAHAPGSKCERCGHELTATDDVRRTAAGEWVHETCPAS